MSPPRQQLAHGGASFHFRRYELPFEHCNCSTRGRDPPRVLPWTPIPSVLGFPRMVCPPGRATPFPCVTFTAGLRIQPIRSTEFYFFTVSLRSDPLPHNLVSQLYPLKLLVVNDLSEKFRSCMLFLCIILF